MNRKASVSRQTKETDISVSFGLDGSGVGSVATGIPFFDHMLTAFMVHGFFDLDIRARGDLEVDFHHTTEDIGIVMGQSLAKALADKKQIARFGDATVPMDEALSKVTIDLSGRPYLIYNFPDDLKASGKFSAWLANEFFQAFCKHGKFNLHINCFYGTNEHHVLESIFKALGRALHTATRLDGKIVSTLSSNRSLQA